MKALLASLLLALAALPASAAPPALIPQPRQVEWRDGSFARASYRLEGASNSAPAVAALARLMGPPGDQVRRVIALHHAPVPGARTQAEAYQLDVAIDRIDLTAATPAGHLYAVRTLLQLGVRGGDAFPACRIVDWPAFDQRGFMHDVGRNPQDVELLKQFMDIMSLYKLNLFHLHLTDDPGWRIECRVHPELNDPRNQRPTRRPGFFYTYAQLNDLIAYGRDRGITVLPEIDMPGHSAYFKAAFGVDMQDARGEQILKDCLAEFLDQVQTPALHIGSDEVRLRSPKFMDRMADFVRARGREVVVWRPGLRPAGRVTTQSWSAGGKPNGPLPGLPFLDSRQNYVNHMDPFDAALRSLNLATCDRAEGDDLLRGGILCHWPDVNAGDQRNIYRQSPVFPALLASAERYWRGHTPERPDLWARLPATNDPAFASYVDFEDRLVAHRDLYFRGWPFPYVRQTAQPWKLIGPFDHHGKVEAAFPVEAELRGSYTVDGRTYRWIEARGATLHVNHFWYDGWLPRTNSGTAYALTYVRSPRPQTVDFWIGFNGPSRSDRRVAGAAAGQWNHSGGRIWIGDTEIKPPAWQQPGLAVGTLEVPFLDEDYFYRPPVPVALSNGWNRILVKAPKGGADWKWMFTCVPVKMDGDLAREVDGLVFATEPRP